MKKQIRFARGFFALQSEEESGLAPADGENAARRKISRKDVYFFMG